MPSREEITCFNAGPAALPTEVVEEAARALVNFQDTGLGIAEHSHRSKIAANIIQEAKADLASFLDIPDGYEVLFMQGGGSGEFSASAYNFAGNWVARKVKELGSDEKNASPELAKAVKENLKLDYIITGGWSQKAAAEAERLFGKEYVNIVADSRKESPNGKYGTIPDESTWNLSKDAALVYYCDNETVHGVEFPQFPKSLEPGPDGKGPIVIADMSSNILSRKIPIRNYSAIFFGAQKNLGTTGITVVIIKKEFLPQASVPLMRQLGLPIPPQILEYETVAKNNSLYNTLSIFDVYVAGQVLKRLLRQHGDAKVSGQQAVSEKKAQIIYEALETYPDFYSVIPSKAVRSRMNICFNIKRGEEAEEKFLAEGTKIGLTGLKGHRSLKGIRASNYNAIPIEGAEKLVRFIHEFAKSNN